VDVFGGAPKRQLTLEAMAEPAVKLFVQREGLVGHMLHHGFVAIACRNDLLDVADQQQQVLRFTRGGGSMPPLRQAPRVDRVPLVDGKRLRELKARAEAVTLGRFVQGRLHKLPAHGCPASFANET
jgi:hypothetical protein